MGDRVLLASPARMARRVSQELLGRAVLQDLLECMVLRVELVCQGPLATWDSPQTRVAPRGKLVLWVRQVSLVSFLLSLNQKCPNSLSSTRILISSLFCPLTPLSCALSPLCSFLRHILLCNLSRAACALHSACARNAACFQVYRNMRSAALHIHQCI